jgi:hypothetical protein
MQSCRGATVSGFNQFIREQREVGGACYVTLTKFDTNGLRIPYQNLSIDMVPDLSFHPGAGTNLWDTVGQRVTAVLEEGRPGRSLIVVITDGENTTSSVFRSPQAVAEVVARALNSGVSFLYFGAGRRARSEALAMGFPDHVITEFDTREMDRAMNQISQQAKAFRVERLRRYRNAT